MKKKLSLLFIVAAFLPVIGESGTSLKGQEAVNDAIIASSSSAVVETLAGRVAGYKEDDIYKFKGIPYAKARRFMPPEPVDKWEGIRSSRAFGPTCPQAKRHFYCVAMLCNVII